MDVAQEIGALRARMDATERRLDRGDARSDHMAEQIDKLVRLAERGTSALSVFLWLGGAATAVFGIWAWFYDHWPRAVSVIVLAAGLTLAACSSDKVADIAFMPADSIEERVERLHGLVVGAAAVQLDRIEDGRAGDVRAGAANGETLVRRLQSAAASVDENPAWVNSEMRQVAEIVQSVLGASALRAVSALAVAAASRDPVAAIKVLQGLAADRGELAAVAADIAVMKESGADPVPEARVRAEKIRLRLAELAGL